MSWIRQESAAGAPAPLQALFERIRARSAHHEVASLWRTLALDPAGLEAIFTLVRTLMDDPAPLTRAQAEGIAVVVSVTNGCGYCVAHHGPKLAAALGDEALARAVALDYREANLAARDRVLLDACVALTCEPAERTRADLDRLREYGFSDEAVLKATEIAALYGLINRLVSGLGIALESGVAPWEFGSTT